MDVDRYTVAFLVGNPDAPQLTDEEADALQDAHLAHLADLHDAGHLPAAGPLLARPHDLRGLLVFAAATEQTLELMHADPAVRAGALTLAVTPWQVPAGALRFHPARFPRSMAEATAP